MENLDASLRDFERRIDSSDPSQIAALDELRSLTRELHKVRGDWDKADPDYRSWNAPPPQPSVATVPDDLKAYLEHKEAERRDAAETVLLALEAAGANGAPTLPAKPPKAPLEERVARYRRSVLRRAGLLDED